MDKMGMNGMEQEWGIRMKITLRELKKIISEVLSSDFILEADDRMLRIADSAEPKGNLSMKFMWLKFIRHLG